MGTKKLYLGTNFLRRTPVNSPCELSGVRRRKVDLCTEICKSYDYTPLKSLRNQRKVVTTPFCSPVSEFTNDVQSKSMDNGVSFDSKDTMVLSLKGIGKPTSHLKNMSG